MPNLVSLAFIIPEICLFKQTRAVKKDETKALFLLAVFGRQGLLGVRIEKLLGLGNVCAIDQSAYNKN